MAGKGQDPHILAAQHARPPLQGLQSAGAAAVIVTVDASKQAVVMFLKSRFLTVIDGGLCCDEQSVLLIVVNVGYSCGYFKSI